MPAVSFLLASTGLFDSENLLSSWPPSRIPRACSLPRGQDVLRATVLGATSLARVRPRPGSPVTMPWACAHLLAETPLVCICPFVALPRLYARPVAAPRTHPGFCPH